MASVRIAGNRRRMYRPLWAMLTFVLLTMLLAWPFPASSQLGPAVAQALGVQDTPTTLVADGVSDYTLAAPKIFWHTDPLCAPSLNVANAEQQTNTEVMRRIATYGSTVRELYRHDVPFYSPSCDNAKQVDSPIIADANYVYWVSGTNLVRLSTSANVGDAPSTLAIRVNPGALAQDTTNIYILSITGSNPNYTTTIRKISKADGTVSPISTFSGFAANLQADGEFVYWLNAGRLNRYNVGAGGITLIGPSGVTGYYPEGTKSFFFCTINPGGCNTFTTKYVFIGVGGQVVRYNNVDDASTTIYTSTYTANTVAIYELVSDGTSLFVFEDRTTACSQQFCFNNHDNALFRTRRGTGGTPASLYIQTGVTSQSNRHLTTDGTYLFWQTGGGVVRLPNDASALPKIDMRVTGMEITQGIQDLNNSVRLIQNRRTFVRVYVKSDGASVPGVTATLFATWSGGSGGPLMPVNPIGSHITVPAAPNRNTLNHSFLFELPWSWTTKSSVTFRAELNPYHLPLQNSYANNSLTRGSFTFQTSPRLQVQFISWGYKIGDTTYYPDPNKDVQQTYSWIRRAYPLASTPGSYSDTTPGFRPRVWTVFDSKLAKHVDGTDADCASLVTYNPNGTIKSNDRNLCASAYTNSRMAAMRSENGTADSVFFYGMISDRAGIFPRGQACCGTNVSTGPAGAPGSAPSYLGQGWDTDTTYADWYAGHEIGHTLGRAHPTPNGYVSDANPGCGQSRSDNSYPYAQALIGTGINQLEGFDGGDSLFSIPKAVYPSSIWHDLMSYCNSQWISDYTYNGMYDYMKANPSTGLQLASAPQVDGDFLSVYGELEQDFPVGTIFYLRRQSTVGSIPAIVPGPYSIQLVSSGGTVLASYPFTPEASDETVEPRLSFGQIVQWKPGTARVQIVRIADNKVFTSRVISGSAPVVSNVVLRNAPNPVAGNVTLEWAGSDADGDALQYDVLYSRDNGQSFQMLQLDVAGTSTVIDTSRLGGGTAILRVVASDGAQSGRADSAPFTMANKPPQPRILEPGDQTRIRYGQLLNLSGEAEDAQDDSVAANNLVWSVNGTPQTDRGPLLTLTDLRVGPNQVTLTATNSANQTATTSITVFVDDDLSLPGPSLAIGPSQVAWHVGPGTTDAQTAAVTIDNAGSGDISWTATSSVPWLTLSAANGDAPGTLTISANPAAIPNGTTGVANVVITKPAVGGEPAQTITVPVALSVGDLTPPSPQTPLPSANMVYLPLVRR